MGPSNASTTKQRAVSHLEDALDLAAEVGMARSVDDVNLHALVLDGDVLRQNGNAALALLVVESSTRSSTF